VLAYFAKKVQIAPLHAQITEMGYVPIKYEIPILAEKSCQVFFTTFAFFSLNSYRQA